MSHAYVANSRLIGSVVFVVAGLIQMAEAQAPRVLTVAQFEKSALFQKYKLVRKDHWSLRSGGTNFSYAFPDPDNDDDQEVGFEMNSDPSNITSIDVNWIGESTLKPARLAPRREVFLRDIIQATYPDVNADTVLAYVRAEQGRRYPGGGNTMPRKRLPTALIYAGVVGADLLVGIDRPH